MRINGLDSTDSRHKLPLEHNNQYLPASQGSWSSVVKQRSEVISVCVRGGKSDTASAGRVGWPQRWRTAGTIRDLTWRNKSLNPRQNLSRRLQSCFIVRSNWHLSIHQEPRLCIFTAPLAFTLYTLHKYFKNERLRGKAMFVHPSVCMHDTTPNMLYGWVELCTGGIQTKSLRANLILVHVSPIYEMQVENFWLYNAQSMWCRQTNNVCNTSVCGSRHSSVISLGVGLPRNHSSIPARGDRFFSSSKRPYQPRALPSS